MIEIKQWYVVLQEFFSSVFTIEPDNDFDKLPRRVNDQSKQMSDFNISQEKIEEKLHQTPVEYRKVTRPGLSSP